MPLTPRRTDSIPPLSSERRQVLLHGPHTIGKPLSDFPHDTLRDLWRVHGPTLIASKGCPRQPWFVTRDQFVEYVRRELL